MNKYLNGTILEMLERVKTLKTKIPVSTLPECFKQLASTAISELDINISELEKLYKDPKFQVSSNLPFKLNAFQKLVQTIDYLENYVIVSLHRCSKEDEILTKLIDKICKEINYPLLSPVASRLSLSYYWIDIKFNHLRVPLLESDFFLHMPDLYHELAHPLISIKNHPNIAAFQEKLGQFNLLTTQYFKDRIQEYRRNDGKEEAKFLEMISECWIEAWSVELFCDLFGVFTLGPAYAWAHLHLCVKRGNNPFDTPEYYISSHPADDSRMQTILLGLELVGFKKDVNVVKEYWQKYVDLSGGTIDANFKLAYPKELLEHCTTMALEGTKAIKCQVANIDSKNEVYDLLNTAWSKFSNDPIDYIGWEKLQREKYKLL